VEQCGALGRSEGGLGDVPCDRARLLRRFGAAGGLDSDFTIMGPGRREDLMQLSRASLGIRKRESDFPKKEDAAITCLLPPREHRDPPA